MIGEHFPKVSLPSRQSLKSYNAKFAMDKCNRNKYGATLTITIFQTSQATGCLKDGDAIELKRPIRRSVISAIQRGYLDDLPGLNLFWLPVSL